MIIGKPLTIGGGGGLTPTIYVNSITGSTITCDGIQGTEVSGTWTFKVSIGTHTIVGQYDGKTSTETVVVDAVGVYEVNIVFSNIPENTVLLLHFNDNLIDETSRHSPSWYGTPSYQSGKFEKCVSFSGSSSITIANDIDFEFGANDFTIACWIKPNSFSSWQGIFSGRGQNKYSVYASISDGNGISCGIGNGSSFKEIGVSNASDYMPIGQWSHFAVVRSGNNYKLFINGIERSSDTWSGSTSQNAPFQIGRNYYVGGSSGQEYLNGSIDEFIVVNGTALWEENFTPPTEPYY